MGSATVLKTKKWQDRLSLLGEGGQEVAVAISMGEARGVSSGTPMDALVWDAADYDSGEESLLETDTRESTLPRPLTAALLEGCGQGRLCLWCSKVLSEVPGASAGSCSALCVR